jgi:S1-C subfamily serine protease
LLAVASLLGFPALAAKDPNKTAQKAIESGVVKISVHSNPPNLLFPWQKVGTQSASGSGVIIDGNRILTCAHVVEDAVSVEVKRAGMSEPFVADLAYVGHDCDLALLTVKDERFFQGATPLELGGMPDVQDPVSVHGFPIGGDTISVSSGIVSRIEVSTYVHSFENLLEAQIDASTNPGNSGGPVVADGRLVGIAIETLEDAENIGYMVPTPVIRHFLDDVSDGIYDGFPRLGADLQPLKSGAHRQSLGMKEGQTGALVCRVDHGSPASQALQSGDVLLEIDGHAVANDMTIQRPGLGRVSLSEAYRSKQIGESFSLALLRGGQRMQREVELTRHQFLVAGRRDEDEPEYFVFGGVLFQPLTIKYLTYFNEVPFHLANHAFIQNSVSEDRRQVILIQKVLPHPVNRGYQKWEDLIVDRVNGIVPRDMGHLAQIIDSSDEPWLEIVTEDQSFMVLSLPRVRAAQQAILNSFGIARDRSPGLRGSSAVADAR